jgi:hypothetical protein
MAEVVSLLGVNDSGGRRATLWRKVTELGLDTGHFRRPTRPKYSVEQLAEAVAAATSVNGVLDRLAIPRRGGAHSHISRRIRAAGLDTSHFSHALGTSRPSYEQFDRARLAAAVDGARSMKDVLRRLGLPESEGARAEIRRQLHAGDIEAPAGFRRVRLDTEAVVAAAAGTDSVAGMMRLLGLPVDETNRRRIVRLIGRHGIDTAHFRRGSTGSGPARNPAALLVERPAGASRVRGATLRRVLGEVGVPALCAGCGTGEVWQGELLTLEVDHINGRPFDNRRENLRLLCPNCHSQTETFAGRNRGMANQQLCGRGDSNPHSVSTNRT